MLLLVGALTAQEHFPPLKKPDCSVWETAFQNKAWLFGSSVGAHGPMIGSSAHTLKRARLGSAAAPLTGRGGRSYQDDGADGVGGQDVILQGSAVTLGFDVGGTLVMELEEAEEGINGRMIFCSVFSCFYLHHTCCCCCFIFYHFAAANKCFLSVNWCNDL